MEEIGKLRGEREKGNVRVRDKVLKRYYVYFSLGECSHIILKYKIGVTSAASRLGYYLTSATLCIN